LRAHRAPAWLLLQEPVMCDYYGTNWQVSTLFVVVFLGLVAAGVACLVRRLGGPGRGQ